MLNKSINNFNFNIGRINERYVNIRTEPTNRSELFCVLYRNTNVNITSIGNDLFRVAQMLDFWLEIEIGNNKYWIYGYYVEFLNEIYLM